MNEESTQPSGGKKSPPKIIWLFVAFIPSAAAFAYLININASGQWMLTAFSILNGVCSFISAAKLLDGVKHKQVQIGLRFMLGLIFFVLNTFVAVFVGCSSTKGVLFV